MIIDNSIIFFASNGKLYKFYGKGIYEEIEFLPIHELRFKDPHLNQRDDVPEEEDADNKIPT